MTEITEAGLAIAAQPATRPGLQREIAGIIIRDVLQEDQDDLVEGYFDEIMQAAKRIALLPAYNVVARAFETNAAEHMLKAAAECTRLQEELTRLQEENGQLRLAICGGEDAPGYADSLPLADILGVAANNLGSWREASDRAARLQEEVKGLRWLLDERAQADLADAIRATLQGQQS
jgi:hypothetical protein